MKGVTISGIIMTILIVAACYTLFDLGHGPVETLPEFLNMSIEDVMNRLGAPAHEFSYNSREVVGELRTVLQNHYPPERFQEEAIELKELSWIRRYYTITLWFHKVNDRWIVLETCRWQNHVKF